MLPECWSLQDRELTDIFQSDVASDHDFVALKKNVQVMLGCSTTNWVEEALAVFI